MLENVPEELRGYRQWVVWRYETRSVEKPTKVPYCPLRRAKASPTDPTTWAGFYDAVNALSAGGFNGIGFVLTDNDPFTFIDLDDTQGDQEALARQIALYNDFNSYSERSPSGNGLHIIVRATVPAGRRDTAAKIEVYSNARYMTVTGDVFNAQPIQERQAATAQLWASLGGGTVSAEQAQTDKEQTETDDEIVSRASSAVNGEKFVDLYAGRWEIHYPSQSEADYALIDIVAYYTQNREQIARIFRASGLGNRAKAKRHDYVASMISKSFDRLPGPIDFTALSARLDAQMQNATAKWEAQDAPFRPVDCPPRKDTYNVPPGLLGQIAQFIYAAAPRPVPEIALVGAIGLMAGICGRAYNVSDTGLNQYVLLLANTGTGKEAIARGISKLTSVLKLQIPAVDEFVGPAEIASPQALIKYMSKTSPCFCSVVGEFGIALKQLSDPRAPSHMVGLRRMILDLYNKSGASDVLRPTIYSDKAKNTDVVIAPAFSLVGESTPERFFGALDDSMIAEGLLPRFMVVQYDGPRPPLAAAFKEAVPSSDLINALAALCENALMMMRSNKAIDVDFEPQAEKAFRAFNTFCDNQINYASKDVVRELWNRAHLKSMKLAALVAVGINAFFPKITPDVAEWAINLVTADVQNLLKRFESGFVGAETAETKQIAEVIRMVKEHVQQPFDVVRKYKATTEKMYNDRVIPWSYLSRRLMAVSAFRLDRIGASNAVKRSVAYLVETGDLREVPKQQAQERYDTSAKLYAVANAVTFGLC